MISTADPLSFFTFGGDISDSVSQQIPNFLVTFLLLSFLSMEMSTQMNLSMYPCIQSPTALVWMCQSSMGTIKFMALLTMLKWVFVHT